MKTVIEMAREAGLPEAWISDTGVLKWSDLERFAELVRADEREAMMQLFTDPENQPTQHDTVTVQYMLREIAAEREACAALVENMDGCSQYFPHVPEYIRARLETMRELSGADKDTLKDYYDR